MKKFLTQMISLSVLTFGLSQASFAATETQTTLPSEIKVGMSGTYYPFTFQEMGKLQGFEIDLWDEIGKRNNIDVEYKTANFSGLFGLLETGRIDTISNQISISEARQAKYLFSEPYVIDGIQITVKKGNESIQSVDDLKGKTVAVNLGSNFEQELRKYDTDNEINIKTYDTGIEQDVVLGRSDAFVMDRLSALTRIKKSGLPLQLAGEPFETIENAWPFLKTEKGEALVKMTNQTLDQMREDGTLAKISEKWFGMDVTKK